MILRLVTAIRVLTHVFVVPRDTSAKDCAIALHGRPLNMFVGLFSRGGTHASMTKDEVDYRLLGRLGLPTLLSKLLNIRETCPIPRRTAIVSSEGLPPHIAGVPVSFPVRFWLVHIGAVRCNDAFDVLKSGGTVIIYPTVQWGK